MAETLATILLLSLAVALGGLALRVLGLRARRGGGAAELWVALFFLGIAAELSMRGINPEADGLANGIAVSASSLSLLVFVQTVFRPNERWAVGLACLLGGGITAIFIVPHLFGATTPAIRLGWTALRASALVWTFSECLLYHARMKRRVRIGLADPIVANRFLLWALWTGGAALMPLAGFVVRSLSMLGIAADVTQSQDVAGGALLLFGVVASGMGMALLGLWLSFFPPTRYCRWLERRAEALAVA